LSIYALLNRIRICASGAVLSEAERALASITDHYFSPNLSLEQLHALVRDGTRADPLQSFAEACCAEVRSEFTGSLGIAFQSDHRRRIAPGGGGGISNDRST
jgi:hypothetical protein